MKIVRKDIGREKGKKCMVKSLSERHREENASIIKYEIPLLCY